MTFKQSILLALSFLFVSTIFGQTYNSIISDKEIIDFVNWQLKTEKKYSEEPKHKLKQLYIGISKWDTTNFFPTRKKDTVGVNFRNYLFYSINKWLDTIFSQQDKEFLYKQFTSQIDTFWRHGFANSKPLKSTKQKNLIVII